MARTGYGAHVASDSASVFTCLRIALRKEFIDSRVVFDGCIRHHQTSPGFSAQNFACRNGRPLLGNNGPNCNLLRFFSTLFSRTLSRHSLLQSALLARLQVVGVTPHFLNDVFRLNLALEPTKGVLQRLALLQSNFCQTHHPPTSHKRTY
jgi:hypothetical protein